MGPQTRRLMGDAVHVEGIQADLLWHPGPPCSGRLRNLHRWPLWPKQSGEDDGCE
jgi:hypothetical protein